MILWLNGAFGAGKTVTAAELHRRQWSRLEFSSSWAAQQAAVRIRAQLRAIRF